MNIFFKGLLLCLSLGLIAACSDKAENAVVVSESDTTIEKVVDSVKPREISYEVEHKAALVKNLPEKTLAYIRIPNLAGYLNSAQADAIYPALLDSNIQNQSAAILQGVEQNLLSLIDDQASQALIRALVLKQESPVEVALLAGMAGIMTPEVILQVKLNIEGREQLLTLLQSVVDSAQGMVQLTKEPDSEGRFQLFSNGLTVHGQFDSSNRDFVLFGGPTADVKTFNTYLDKILPKRDDLFEFEQTFDSAGSGLALWFDTAQLWGLAGPMVPPEIAASLDALNIQDTEFLYFGTGAKAGAGSAKLHLQYEKKRQTPFVFLPSNAVLEAKTGGKANYVSVLPMLSKDNFNQIVKIEKSFTQKSSLESSFNEFNEIAKTEVGADFSELLGAFGSSIAIVNDQSGTWASVEIIDNEAFKKLISVTSKELGAKFEKQAVQGVDIAHYTFPSLGKLAMKFDDENDLSSVEGAEALMQVFWGANTHFYMVREGKNLIVATLPQVLIARDRRKTSVTAQSWLNDLKVDTSSSMLSLTADVEELPKKAYHLYLSGVQTLSDIAGVEPNLMSLPLAEDLGLAESGRVGLGVDTGQHHISLNLNYSQSPLDLFFGGDTMTMVAVTGILAGIAVPAYQDYTVRAKGAEALNLASQLKAGIGEFYLSEGRFPNKNEAQNFALSLSSHEVWFDTETNSIVVDYGYSVPQLEGTQIIMNSRVSASGFIEWDCFSESVPQKYLPGVCRN